MHNMHIERINRAMHRFTSVLAGILGVYLTDIVSIVNGRSLVGFWVGSAFGTMYMVFTLTVSSGPAPTHRKQNRTQQQKVNQNNLSTTVITMASATETSIFVMLLSCHDVKANLTECHSLILYCRQT